MKRFLLVFLLLVSGCGQSYEIADGAYVTELDAVSAFYEGNKPLLRRLRTEQEMLGWVVLCNDGYYRITKPRKGAGSNPVDVFETFEGCTKIAFMHSHPTPPRGMTTDFFSEADLNFAKTYPIYMMAQERCFLRYADADTVNNRGTYKAWLDCPSRKFIRLK